jgi:hypothetical protein
MSSLGRATGGMAVVILLTAGIATGPAAARTPDSAYLLVSDDGVAFSRTSDLHLFQDMGRVVPGDEGVERIWIKSQAPADGELRVEIFDVVVDDPALAAAMTLTVTMLGETRELRLDDAAASDKATLVLNSAVVTPGSVVQIDAAMSVDKMLGGEHGSDGTLGTVGFSTRATISGDGSAAPSTSEGPLAATGADVWGVGLAGVAALVCGLSILLRNKRNLRDS